MRFQWPDGRATLLRAVFLLGFLGVSHAGFGDTPLRDPSIPDGEIAVYRMEEGDREWRFTEKVRVSSENGREIYGILYESENETIEVKIQKDSMVPFSVYTVNTSDAMTVESSTRVSLVNDIDTRDIIVLSFSDLKYILRGFPFAEDASDLAIEFLNGGSDDDDEGPNFEIKVSYLDTEEILIDGDRSVECYKLELKMRASGIMRVLNTFIGKTYFWYSVEAPHYLVAYEGSSGFPGSARSYVQIENYSGW